MLANYQVLHWWGFHFRESTDNHSEKLVSLDNYYSHCDSMFQHIMRRGNSLLDYIPADCSDLVQSNDRNLGKTFKDAVSRRIEDHLEENWDTWYEGDMHAADRRVLLTQFAGEAWEEMCDDQDAITRAFEACGLLLRPDLKNLHRIRIIGYDGDYSLDTPSSRKSRQRPRRIVIDEDLLLLLAPPPLHHHP